MTSSLRRDGAVAEMRDIIRELMAPETSQRKSWWTSIRTFFSSALPTSKSSCFRSLRRPATILVAGLDDAGKTTLLERLGQTCGRDVESRCFFSGAQLEMLRCSHVSLFGLDVGGGRPTGIYRFEAACFQVCDALIFMVDSADHDRMAEAREELYRALRGYKGDTGLKSGVPVLVLANKLQKEGAATYDELAEVLKIEPTHQSPQIRELIGDRPLRLVGTDMNANQGITEALAWLTTMLNSEERKISPAELDDKQASTKI